MMGIKYQKLRECSFAFNTPFYSFIKQAYRENKRVTFQILGQKLNRMSRANLGMFEADLSASLPNL